MPSLPCFHVTTTARNVFGVAATGKTEARQMVQDRMTRDERDERPGPRPADCVNVGRWDADFGTVLEYGPVGGVNSAEPEERCPACHDERVGCLCPCHEDDEESADG